MISISLLVVGRLIELLPTNFSGLHWSISRRTLPLFWARSSNHERISASAICLINCRACLTPLSPCAAKSDASRRRSIEVSNSFGYGSTHSRDHLLVSFVRISRTRALLATIWALDLLTNQKLTQVLRTFCRVQLWLEIQRTGSGYMHLLMELNRFCTNGPIRVWISWNGMTVDGKMLTIGRKESCTIQTYLKLILLLLPT